MRAISPSVKYRPDSQTAYASADSSSVERDAGAHDVAARDVAAGDAVARDSTGHDVVGVDATGPDRTAEDATVVTVDGGGWDRSVAGYNLVFVTSTSYTPQALAGHGGADAICQGLASSAGRSGTFVAWFSTSTRSAAWTGRGQGSAGRT